MLCSAHADHITVSAIVPVKNGAKWLPECLDSLLSQELPSRVQLQVSVYDDGSTDETPEILEHYGCVFSSAQINYIVSSSSFSRGVGYAKNRAVQQSIGQYLCFCDADDVSLRLRIRLQLAAALSASNPQLVIVGGKFIRDPEGSTMRYTNWANSLSNYQLHFQVYTSHGPTLVAPTWFLHRELYNRIGGFYERKCHGFPEDLKFFFDAMLIGTSFIRVDEPVTVYRYHPDCASLKVGESEIWKMRVEMFQNSVLPFWDRFTIWNAGKQGKRFFRSLAEENQRKVIAFSDIDVKKLARRRYEQFDEKTRHVLRTVPIIPICDMEPPVAICVKLGLTGGDFEKILVEKRWIEGVDYYHLG